MLFIGEPDPENPGWHVWQTSDPTRFNGSVIGKMIVRREGERSARLRMFPRHLHSNVIGTVHGGVTMAFIDIALFATMACLSDGLATETVTLDVTTQFIGAGQIDQPLDAVTEVLRETRRLLFLRGLIMQDETITASFSATVRKPTRK